MLQMSGGEIGPDEGSRMRWILVVALTAIVVGGTTDLVLDQPGSWLSAHVIFELLMIAGAAVLATTLWLGWWRAVRSARELRTSLEARREERDAWRDSAEKALVGLGVAIDRKFDEWELTPTEREVALFLLKGYTHKGIARITDRGHQTVRQHATTIYRKAGLSGRAELAAFFLEGLMLPEQEGGEPAQR